MKIIVVDVGGTNLKIALIKKGRVLKFKNIKTPSSEKKLLNEVVNGIKAFNSFSISKIGVSVAGPVKNVIIKNPPNLPLKNFDLKTFLENKFRKKIAVENDANCAALSELYYGVKKSNFVVITLGTGVGCGVIINKKLYVGEGYASELGHMIIDNGRDLEYYWQLHRKKSKKYFGKEFFIKELMEMNNKKANDMVKENIQHMAQGFASIINIFDPEVIVITGGGRNNGVRYLNSVRRETHKYVIIPKKTPIYYSRIEHPELIGASLL